MTASSSALWSRFSPPSYFVDGHVSTVWFMVCRWPQSQEGDWVRPHLCKLARRGPWPVWNAVQLMGQTHRQTDGQSTRLSDTRQTDGSHTERRMDSQALYDACQTLGRLMGHTERWMDSQTLGRLMAHTERWMDSQALYDACQTLGRLMGHTQRDGWTVKRCMMLVRH